MTIFGGVRNEMDRRGGGFEGISKTCPWRKRHQKGKGILLTGMDDWDYKCLNNNIECIEENCALWHWLYVWYEACVLRS